MTDPHPGSTESDTTELRFDALFEKLTEIERRLEELWEQQSRNDRPGPSG